MNLEELLNAATAIRDHCKNNNYKSCEECLFYSNEKIGNPCILLDDDVPKYWKLHLVKGE